MRVSPMDSESAGALAQGSVPAASTVIVWDPTRPSTVAVIVAVPAATPVTTPAGETDATWEAEDAQVADLPVTDPPDASKAANVSVTCWPTVIVVLVAATLTVATAFGPAGSGDPPPPQASAMTTMNGTERYMDPLTKWRKGRAVARRPSMIPCVGADGGLSVTSRVVAVHTLK